MSTCYFGGKHELTESKWSASSTATTNMAQCQAEKSHQELQCLVDDWQIGIFYVGVFCWKTKQGENEMPFNSFRYKTRQIKTYLLI